MAGKNVGKVGRDAVEVDAVDDLEGDLGGDLGGMGSVSSRPVEQQSNDLVPSKTDYNVLHGDTARDRDSARRQGAEATKPHLQN